MSQKQLIIRVFSLIVLSAVLTLLLANKIGNSLTGFEAGIYQKISGKKPQHVLYDSTGIPVIVYEGKLGKQYNTVTVAEQAIKWSDDKDTAVVRDFFNCIKWLTNNYAFLNDSSIIYLDYYDWPSFKMTSPWRSAMNQGRAMQAFLKAFEKTRDSIYLSLCQKINEYIVH